MRLGAFIAILLLTLASKGQGTGEIRLNIDPGHNFEFILDGQYRMQQKSIKLSAGQHNFKLWAPERIIVDTNLQVYEDSTKIFNMVLPYSLEYQQWKDDMRELHRKFAILKVPITTLVVGTGIWAIASYANYKGSHDALMSNRDLYHQLTVPYQITTVKREIQQNKDDVAKWETHLIVSSSLCVASGIAMYFLYRKAKRMEVPIFDDRMKVVFDGLVYNFGEHEHWAGKFKLKF